MLFQEFYNLCYYIYGSDMMISLTWHGTFTLKLKNEKDSILFDPFIRYDKRLDNDFRNNFYGVKDIFITHGHLDHTMDLCDLYKNKNVKIHTTNTPYNRLLNDGLNKEQLVKINYHDNFNVGKIKVTVLRGKHIKFDTKLVLDTLFNKNVIKYSKNLPIIIKNHLKCHENNETICYLVNVENKSILFMGSMALHDDENYPTYVDYLVLAYQGRSDLDKKIVPILNKIKPKRVIIAHFDNSFPPVSKDVNISNLRKIINKDIKLIIPKYEEEIKL